VRSASCAAVPSRGFEPRKRIGGREARYERPGQLGATSDVLNPGKKTMLKSANLGGRAMDASGILVALVVIGVIVFVIWGFAQRTTEREQRAKEIARRDGLEPDFFMEYNSVGAGGAEGAWYHIQNDKIAFAIYRKQKLMRVIFKSNSANRCHSMCDLTK